jgi:signal transduction histidine kinase
LETTYSKLQAEVSRLRQELEGKNRRLAQSLEENQRMRSYLARILERLPCGVLVFDEDMHLRMINPAARRLLSTEPDFSGPCSADPSLWIGGVLPAIGNAEPPRSRGALQGRSTPSLLSAWLAQLPKEECRHEQEWVVQGAQAERTLGVTRAYFPANTSGEDSIVILRDLTEAKQLEREREVARRTQALAEVATLLAHEIRNPLGSLELFAGLLADALADQTELRPWINHLQAGLRVLAATVNNVLHFHNQSPAQLRPVDLLQVVRESLEFLGPLAQQKEMRIDFHTPEVSVQILADTSRLQQAFFNLALNAFQAMKPGGTLSVQVHQREGDSGLPGQAGGVATVAFADQGVGIPEENLGGIFEPGFTTHSGSPGFGLAVTRKVVEQHGGRISVESQEGQGTTFTLALPLAAEREVG